MVNQKINIANISFKNPVLTASGTFGYGTEFEDFMDINKLGGLVVKSITAKARQGNAYPRMTETASGMLNAVGLQNKGVDYFINTTYPRIKDYQTEIIANVPGSTVEEYVEVCERLNELEKVKGVEINISCPNVKEGGMAFGTSCPATEKVVREVRKVYKKALIIKLSPNVTDITEFAKICEAEGADSISLINTLLAMAIDAKTRKPKLSTVTGGLSGPAIKPVALRMVWQCFQAVKIPIMGMGGIMNATDAIEFMLAGSSVVQVGTANFIDPEITVKIVKGMEKYFIENNIKNASDIIGKLEIPK